jgi:tyrosine-protein phosphatase SIW14
MLLGDQAVVSKRSARPYVEYDMGKETQEDQPSRMAKQEEAELGEADRRHSISTGTVHSSQTSFEASPLVRPADEESEDGALWLATRDRRGGDVDLSDAFHPPATTTHPAYSITELVENLPAGTRPANFGIVVPGVYRSSFPQSEDYAFIEGLKLKTIM